MKQNVTTAVILKRINFGEADRIITVITSDFGKLRLMAKGVRRVKSKLAGGIELFSESSITYIPGKRDISTLVSTRLNKHYGNIVRNLDRTTFAYEALKTIDQVTENECEPEFYELIVETLDGVDQTSISIGLVKAWFFMRLLGLLGHEPNISTDADGQALQAGQTYSFDFEAMAFVQNNGGAYGQSHIKTLRLLQTQSVKTLARISQIEEVVGELQPLITAWQKQSLQ